MAAAGLALAATLALVGCGQTRIVGDADGVPVDFSVDISRAFVRDLKHRAPGGGEGAVYIEHGFYAGGPFWYRGRGYCRPDPFWDPFWGGGVWVAGPGPTSIFLIGGDGPGEGRLFRAELDWGHTDFSVTIRPGRVVTLTLQAYGGREGWEEVGSFTADNRPGQQVRLDLLEHAPRIQVIDPPPGPPPLAPPPGAAPPSAGPPADPPLPPKP